MSHVHRIPSIKRSSRRGFRDQLERFERGVTREVEDQRESDPEVSQRISPIPSNSAESDRLSDRLSDQRSSDDALDYKPIVIIEPHLDDDVLGGGSSDQDTGPLADLTPGNLFDSSGKLAVWRQSSSDRLLVGDLLSPEAPIALQQLPRHAKPDGLLSVESHGLGLGGVFRNGRRYLLAIYNRSGELRRTEGLNTQSLKALELKHQADLNRDGRVGPGRGKFSGALLSAAEAGVPVHPLQAMPAWAGSVPTTSQESITASFGGDQSFGSALFSVAPLPMV